MSDEQSTTENTNTNEIKHKNTITNDLFEDVWGSYTERGYANTSSNSNTDTSAHISSNLAIAGGKSDISDWDDILNLYEPSRQNQSQTQSQSLPIVATNSSPMIPKPNTTTKTNSKKKGKMTTYNKITKTTNTIDSKHIVNKKTKVINSNNVENTDADDNEIDNEYNYDDEYDDTYDDYY